MPYWLAEATSAASLAAATKQQQQQLAVAAENRSDGGLTTSQAPWTSSKGMFGAFRYECPVPLRMLMCHGEPLVEYG